MAYRKAPRQGESPQGASKTQQDVVTVRDDEGHICAKVEHPFRIIKCRFGFTKARYRGLFKNDSKWAMMFALADIIKMGQIAEHSGKHNVRVPTSRLVRLQAGKSADNR